MFHLCIPSSSVAQVDEFDTHPRFGALPNLPHDRVGKTEKNQSPMTQPTTKVHPRFGLLPGPPPPKHGTVQSVQSVGEANSIGGSEVAIGLSSLQYSTQDSFSMGSTTTTTTYSTQTFNGDGQHHSLVEADGHFSDMSDRQSCTTASGTVYSGSSAGSGREYAGDYRRPDATLMLESKLEEMDNALQRRTVEVSRLKEKNNQLKQQLREITDQYEELQKQHVQMREQLRQKTLADQKQMFESYKKEHNSTALEERVLLLEKENKALKGYLEQYQRENQQLQLLSVSSTSSSRPHHLPIGGSRVPHSGPPTYSYTPSTPHGTGGDTPAPIITPFKSQRFGDHLSQHNIHIQHSRHHFPHKQTPVYTPSKDVAAIGKRLSSSSGETPIGESYLQSSSSSLNSMQSNGSKGSSSVTLQPTGSEQATMV